MASEPGSSKKKRRVEFRETFERNFITQGRAVKEFLLKPSQLEDLQKYVRRSPYESEMTILVYNRKDVENRAISIWGSLDNLEREKRNLDTKKRVTDQSNYEFKKNLRDARRTESGEKQAIAYSKKTSNEPYVIAIALSVDVMNLVFKLVVWFLTESDSMLAETIHSAADTFNQGILVYGICQRAQKATFRHPYGYSNMMFVVSLISGVGIFCLGAAVTVFHGILALTQRAPGLKFNEIKWAFLVLAFSFITDGICFCCTVVATYTTAKNNGIGFFYYAFTAVEPGLTVILLEDFVAVLGNLIAMTMLAATWKVNNHVPDAVGAIVIGLLLGMVALFLIVTNAAALVGRSIRNEKLEEINNVIESDVMIRGIYDVKGMDLGENLVRYKAEIDFDGAELTRLYLDRMDLNVLLATVNRISNIDELESFLVSHGESIVDMVGGEIDRIECRVRAQFPEIRHVDLEIL
ncbi:hypothetical protein RUM43_005130 [Polyplax serrata]|uniref:Cation efflux protein transmembrane domain-containing protein n=1 Tax=Polyplax serrata TaxID=468196 RepID=A0AAN8SBN2_POLSC